MSIFDPAIFDPAIFDVGEAEPPPPPPPGGDTTAGFWAANFWAAGFWADDFWIGLTTVVPSAQDDGIAAIQSIARAKRLRSSKQKKKVRKDDEKIIQLIDALTKFMDGNPQ